MDNFETAITELENQQYMTKSIEFTVQEDFINNLPAIVSNLEQVEQWAVAQTEQDRSLVLLTDEDFENAKERAAQLNKQIKNIEDRRKEIKKEYNKPYEVFEKACKKVVSVLSEARENLWSQVTKAEEEQKTKKEATFRSYWEEKTKANVVTNRTFEQIFDKKWLNKGVRLETAYAEMDKIYEATLIDIDVIKSLNSEFQISLLEFYKEGHSISEALAYNNRLNAQKQAQIQQEEESRANTQPKEEKPILPQKNEPSEEEEELLRIEFWVEGTPEQIKALGKYIRDNGLKYGKIKN